MKQTKQSISLTEQIKKSNCVPSPENKDNELDNILTHLHNDIQDAYLYLQDNPPHYNITVHEIENVKQIPYPKMFPASSFPFEVREHINITSSRIVTYDVKYYDRDITFHYVTEDLHSPSIKKCIQYSHNMLAWLFIVNQYAKSWCAKKLVTYIYLTHLKKNLPTNSIHVIGELHANTAFTTTCPMSSEIVIFRMEEWFKVFIHETFHNFALDFSDMDNTECHAKLLSIFPVKSDVNLYESYTEFWAEIMNVCFSSYYALKNKNNTNTFITDCKRRISIEQAYSVFQMVKILAFMGMDYQSLYSKSKRAETLRATLYRENTNILAYYVVKTILLVNYKNFLSWCYQHNTSLLQFKKTSKNQSLFCKFIRDHYKTSHLLSIIDCTEKEMKQMSITKPKNKKAQNERLKLLHSMRMTVHELY